MRPGRLCIQHFFKDKKDGVFVDIGAHDGVLLSNTYFFEKHLGWKGICIEPIPEIFNQLKANRKPYVFKAASTIKMGMLVFIKLTGFIGAHNEMLSGLKDTYDPKHLIRAQYETRNGAGEIQEVKVNAINLIQF